jgi:Na+/H+ antiporter NhaD/arsenite permease-like protein
MNMLYEIDRRTGNVVGAIACYFTRRYMFPSRPIDLLEAVDFDVLILLSSIMIINYVVIHLKEVKKTIQYFQHLIKIDAVKGFWMISIVAFLVSPFLTNDGVCLLFVEPILLCFKDLSTDEDDFEDLETTDEGNNRSTRQVKMSKLEKIDTIYFLFALSCSTNIGSTLTYTGNPQNMIVASDTISVMPSYKFLAYMILPGVTSWLISKSLPTISPSFVIPNFFSSI